MAPGFEPTTSVINQSIKSSFKPEERAEFVSISSEDHLTSTFRLHRLWLSSVIFRFDCQPFFRSEKKKRPLSTYWGPNSSPKALKSPNCFFISSRKSGMAFTTLVTPPSPRPFRSPFFLPDEKSKIANADVWQSGRYIFKCALCRLTKFKQQS